MSVFTLPRSSSNNHLFFPPTRPIARMPTAFDGVMAAACKKWGVAPNEIKGESRRVRVVRARCDVVIGLRSLGQSDFEIAAFLSRSRDTVRRMVTGFIGGREVALRRPPRPRSGRGKGRTLTET